MYDTPADNIASLPGNFYAAISTAYVDTILFHRTAVVESRHPGDVLLTIYISAT